MTDSVIKTRQQQMRDDLEEIVAMLAFAPGSQRFQDILKEAEQAEVNTFDGLAQLISLANAALMVSSNGVDDEIYRHWYQDMGRRLLARSMDALAVIEASCEPRPAAGLN